MTRMKMIRDPQLAVPSSVLEQHVDPHHLQRHSKDEEYQHILTSSLAQEETKVVKLLRVITLVILLVSGILVCSLVHQVAASHEHSKFVLEFDNAAHQVVDNFVETVENQLNAVAALSTDITSHALHHNQTFPFVTLPDFALKGAHTRILSGAFAVQYRPLVTNETRSDWEDYYALQNRDQIDAAYDQDHFFWDHQNEAFGIAIDDRRRLEEADAPKANITVLDDGTKYHPHLWIPNPVKDIPPNAEGPWLPAWQRSPINKQKQGSLNLVPRSPNLKELQTMRTHKKALLLKAKTVTPAIKTRQEANLRLSQYRQHVPELIDGLTTFMIYPVFDTFLPDTRQLVAVLGTNIHWQTLLSNLLPTHAAPGILCVVDSQKFNQTFAYLIDGPKATFVGMANPAHDSPQYNQYEYGQDLSSYLQERASPRTQAYTTAPLSADYRIRVYPTQVTEEEFITNQPLIHTMVVMVSFIFCAVLFLLFSYVVERRQYIMMMRVVENASKAATAERDLNEFLAHEVRNPLSAALTAGTFISTAVNESEPLKDAETRKFVREDVDVVLSSLYFVNDLLRNILDIYRANSNKIKLTLSPTDIRRDVFDPVKAILCTHRKHVDMRIDCPNNLVVMSDAVRLKQVVLNLVSNASKFVEKGFVCMRAAVVNGNVRLYVEDSGPGIAPEKQKNLFNKYEVSLCVLSQGTGVGLNLCKKMMEIMCPEGELWLDTSFDSGVDGNPGTRFVVQLGVPPIDLDAALPRTETVSQSSRMSHDDSSTHPLRSSDFSRISEDDTHLRTMTETHPTPESIAASELLNECNDRPPTSSQQPLFSVKAPEPPPTSTYLPSPLFALPPGSTTATPSDAATSKFVATSAQVTIDAKEPPAIELPSDISVLFVDDDAVLRKLFVRAVRKAVPSWNVCEAASGESALEMCAEKADGDQPYNIIFLDQYMASTNKQMLGTETAQAMRAKGIKSILIGLSANDIREAFLDAGTDGFMLKPMPCKKSTLRHVLWDILCKDKRAMAKDADIGEGSREKEQETTIQDVLKSGTETQAPHQQCNETSPLAVPPAGVTPVSRADSSAPPPPQFSTSFSNTVTSSNANNPNPPDPLFGTASAPPTGKPLFSLNPSSTSTGISPPALPSGGVSPLIRNDAPAPLTPPPLFSISSSPSGTSSNTTKPNPPAPLFGIQGASNPAPGKSPFSLNPSSSSTTVGASSNVNNHNPPAPLFGIKVASTPASGKPLFSLNPTPSSTTTGATSNTNKANSPAPLFDIKVTSTPASMDDDALGEPCTLPLSSNDQSGVVTTRDFDV